MILEINRKNLNYFLENKSVTYSSLRKNRPKVV